MTILEAAYLENSINMPLSIGSISFSRNNDIAWNVAFELAWTIFEKDEQFSHRSTNILVVNQREAKVYSSTEYRWIGVLQAVQNRWSMSLNLNYFATLSEFSYLPAFMSVWTVFSSELSATYRIFLSLERRKRPRMLMARTRRPDSDLIPMIVRTVS